MQDNLWGILQAQMAAMSWLGIFPGRVLTQGWVIPWLEGKDGFGHAKEEPWMALSLPCTRRGGPSAGGNRQEKGK